MLIAIAIVLLLFVLPTGVGIAVLAAAALAEVTEFVLWRRFLARYRVVTGAEGLVGKTAVVAERCDPDGTVKLSGEIWRARCEASAGPGQTVEVTAVDGLTLLVRPAR